MRANDGLFFFSLLLIVRILLQTQLRLFLWRNKKNKTETYNRERRKNNIDFCAIILIVLRVYLVVSGNMRNDMDRYPEKIIIFLLKEISLRTYG
jgi:phosphatidylglycerophosphate synthase